MTNVVAFIVGALFRSHGSFSMVGFVAGLPFLYQLVERDKKLQVPNTCAPAPITPKLTVG